jgi:hypothetical protein
MMQPLLLLVAAGAAAALIFKRYGRKFAGGSGGSGAMPSKLEAEIVLGGTASQPTVHVCPDPLDAMWGQKIRWTIRDPQNTGAEVWLTGFKPKGSSTKKDPLVGPDQDRKNKANPKEIRDKVKRGADEGKYDYEIWLNGRMAADPDIIIRLAP